MLLLKYILKLDLTIKYQNINKLILLNTYYFLNFFLFFYKI